jgi:hypothetical protein
MQTLPNSLTAIFAQFRLDPGWIARVQGALHVVPFLTDVADMLAQFVARTLGFERPSGRQGPAFQWRQSAWSS